MFFGQRQPVELVEHAADLRVHVADRGVVAVDQRALQIVGQRALLRDVLILPQLAAELRRVGGRAVGRRPSLGKREGSRSYRSQYFFGAQKGRCGLTKPTARKNGSSGAAFARRSRWIASSASRAVGIGVVGHVGRLVRRAARELPRLGERYVGEERLFAGQAVRRAALRQARRRSTRSTSAARSRMRDPRGCRGRRGRSCRALRCDSRAA